MQVRDAVTKPLHRRHSEPAHPQLKPAHRHLEPQGEICIMHVWISLCIKIYLPDNRRYQLKELLNII